ncbi:Pre-mRNA-splicing factor 38A [Actinomortierella wolfii]|nr:Pre-mRNA-splicing factor 38A [Actinomortierella wolfii]
MDNKTVSDAIAVHGTNPQFLIEKILRTRIYESKYWKEQCFGLTESTIVEKAFNLTYIGGQYGTQKPTEFICLVLKLLQLQPSEEIVIKYITGLSEDDDKDDSNKYLRALGAFYLRLTGKPATIYKVLEPLLDDPRKLRKRTVNGFTLTYMDEFVDELLREERVCDVVLPRLTKRYVLEDAGELDPRVSTLETIMKELEDEQGQAGDEGRIQKKVQKQITSHKIIETALIKPFPLKIANS